MKEFLQNAYSVSMDDMMELWIETFHPFGSILVIWDVQTHFELLRELGILTNALEAYKSKAVTVEFSSILDAYKTLDLIEASEISPIMQVYSSGKLVSDNIVK